MFTEAVAKGRRIFNLFTTSTTQANEPSLSQSTIIPEQSIFTNYVDLATYGYIECPPPEPSTLEPLRTCLATLHVDHTLSTENGNNKRVYHEHAKDVIIDGVKYQVDHTSATTDTAHRQPGNRRILLADCQSSRRRAHRIGQYDCTAHGHPKRPRYRDRRFAPTLVRHSVSADSRTMYYPKSH